jgi:hypothetical protein
MGTREVCNYCLYNQLLQDSAKLQRRYLEAEEHLQALIATFEQLAGKSPCLCGLMEMSKDAECNLTSKSKRTP